MGVLKSIADQFARPRGWAARPMAMLLNLANGNLNRTTVDALDLRHGEKVLDIGFGGGVGLREALRQIGSGGSVLGLEVSSELVERARSVFRQELTSGHLAVLEGDVLAIPVGDGRVDAVYSVNTVYFWPDVERGLREIVRVLVSGGRCVLTVQHRAIRGNERFGGYETPPIEKLHELMSAAGLVGVERREPGHDAVLLLGRKPRT